MIAQKLRGLVGQGMSGGRKSVTPVMYSYPPGSYTFTVPKNGWYRFYALGGGGGGQIAGVPAGSGALVVGDRALVKGQTVAVVVGNGGDSNNDGTATTLAFPTDSVSAGGGIAGSSGGAGGTATSTNNLDRLYNGSAKEVAGGGTNGGASGTGLGAGSPGYDGYRGGDGGTSIMKAERGGGGYTSTAYVAGGDGDLLIHQIRLRP